MTLFSEYNVTETIIRIKFHSSSKEITANQFREGNCNKFVKFQWKGDLGANFVWNSSAGDQIICSTHLQEAQSCFTGNLQV